MTRSVERQTAAAGAAQVPSAEPVVDADAARSVVHQGWPGLIRAYADRIGILDGAEVVTLLEGGTPLLPAPALSERTGCEVLLKVEGANPTGSFKDRGMTVAVTAAKAAGATVMLCASTGNTSASAAAYAARAGLECAVLIPTGKIAAGKLAQAVVHGARILQLDGNFDDCLEMARKAAVDTEGVELVNSVNPMRIEGQKTAAFEICDVLGRAPDVHCLPVGNAGNITAYWRGYREYADDAVVSQTPRMFGFQAAGAAPLVLGHPVREPDTIATAIRIGDPASWHGAVDARDASGGLIDAVTDEQILAAYSLLATDVGVFVEPASAASVAGLLATAADGRLPRGSLVVCTVTGNGLKDPDTAMRAMPEPTVLPVTIEAVTAALQQQT
ncbi:threonine synthase [Nakamurella aerolata]|uniref:Threonine synthase n=1 Tax=Nakamurella aerolata TaxID=1656892 RepID=A0A849AC15_9ACTN|nr:threonine synthase [Nakamurella aerolata]NNG37467.1 threonine synthase [Nakamurella aerolata]